MVCFVVHCAALLVLKLSLIKNKIKFSDVQKCSRSENKNLLGKVEQPKQLEKMKKSNGPFLKHMKKTITETRKKVNTIIET